MEMLTKREAAATHSKTAPMKKVLITVDYDTTAQQVAEIGCSLARAMNAEVTLLHVIPDMNYYSTLEFNPIIGFSGFSNNDFLRYANNDGVVKAGQYFLEKLKMHLHDDAIETVVKEGDFAEMIVKTAHDLHSDIIVMGSHRKQWLEKVLWGSVSENVLHQTAVPLLIIPIKEHKTN